jgi:hypothetical protein
VCTFTNKLEHLTQKSDEAIQNIASLYNKDQLTIGSLNVTGEANAGTLTAGSVTDNSMGSTIKTYVDEKVKEAVNQLNTNLDTQVNNLNNNLNNQIGTYRTPVCNWEGWREFCGNCSNEKDDFNLYCTGGRLTQFKVIDNRPFYRNRWVPGFH